MASSGLALLDVWSIGCSFSNLSKVKLTEEEEDVLRLGLNFVPTPKKVPYFDYIVGIDTALRKAKTLLKK